MKRAMLTLLALVMVAGLSHAGTVTGTVTDTTGTPVEGAIVMMRGMGGGGQGPRMTFFRTLTEADGSFSFENVRGGTWPIRASKRLVGHAQADVEVPAEGEVSVDLVLPGCVGEGEGGGRGRYQIRQHTGRN